MKRYPAPKTLTEDGKREWARVVRVLAARGAVEPHLGAVEQLCRALDLQRHAEADLRTRGYSINGVRNPSAAVAMRLGAQVAKAQDALGLTPQSARKLLGRRSGGTPEPGSEHDVIGPEKTSDAWLFVSGKRTWVGSGIGVMMAAGRKTGDVEAAQARAKAYRAAVGACSPERKQR